MATELKVTAKKSAFFYIRAARTFLQGIGDKPAVDELTVSGMGNAINAAVAVAGRMSSDGHAEIVSVETDYRTMEAMNVPHIKIGLKSLCSPSDSVEDVAPSKELIAGKLKAIVKEGGKRGVEIEGACDMGGMTFFCTSMDLPEGDADYLYESLKAAAAKSDPGEEERKGGAGHIGKMFFSAGKDQLAFVCHVPKALQSKVKCDEWIKIVAEAVGGEVLYSSAGVGKAVAKGDPAKDRFPIKMKDAGLAKAIEYLKSKGCFPDKSDSEDDMIFGDDDFPS